MRGLLKGLSVLETVIGVLGLILAVLTLAGGSLMGNAAEGQLEEAVVINFMVVGVVLLLTAIFNLGCGICGLKGAAGNEKMLSKAVILGWLGLIAAVISTVMTLVGNVTASTVISAVCSAIVPVLFLVSAKSVKNQ